jgi:hypothetical protein
LFSLAGGLISGLHEEGRGKWGWNGRRKWG